MSKLSLYICPSVSLFCYECLKISSLCIYSVGRCTDSGGTMTLSVMVKEPGYQDGKSDIGGWICYLVAGRTPLTNTINVDWLGIKVNYYLSLC